MRRTHLRDTCPRETRHGTWPCNVARAAHAARNMKHRRARSGLTPSLLTLLEATAQHGDGDGGGEAASAWRPHHRLRLTPEVRTAALRRGHLSERARARKKAGTPLRP